MGRNNLGGYTRNPVHSWLIFSKVPEVHDSHQVSVPSHQLSFSAANLIESREKGLARTSTSKENMAETIGFIGLGEK